MFTFTSFLKFGKPSAIISSNNLSLLSLTLPFGTCTIQRLVHFMISERSLFVFQSFFFGFDHFNCPTVQFADSVSCLLLSGISPVNFSFQLLYISALEHFVSYPFVDIFICSLIVFLTLFTFSFGSLSNFKTAVLAFLSSKSTIWSFSGTVSVDSFYFPLNELYFPVSLYIL